VKRCEPFHVPRFPDVTGEDPETNFIRSTAVVSLKNVLPGHRPRFGEVAPLYLLLLSANIAIWGWAIIGLDGKPILLGSAMLAYMLGVRHAVDADHIAAIDNVTRKLMHSGKRPISVGLFFALGHSAVIMALSVGVAFAANVITGRLDTIKEYGSIFSTTVSSLFLVCIAISNLFVLASLYRSFLGAKNGNVTDELELNNILNGRGILSRIFGPLLNLVGKSWHMIAVGLVFGLSFDTASEIALFGLSASQASQGMGAATILIFPCLFTAGMTLVDFSDGVLMISVYGWALDNPLRKLYYNMAITALSIAIALFVGIFEGLSLLGDRFGLIEGASLLSAIRSVNDSFGYVGYIVVGLFSACWIMSALVSRGAFLKRRTA
jgi:nickel/cobalt transporter (NiCoT) family protein